MWVTGIALLVLSATSAVSAEGESVSRTLIWHDEFDGPAGQLPDPARWQFDVGTDWGNAQLEFDTDRAENVSLDGEGNLAITARREDFEGQPYTAGRIKTKDLFEQRYGRFEARIKLPIGQGIWPALWMLGANLDEVSWPQCGEIDVMEYRGHEPEIIHGTIHGPGYRGDFSIGNSYTLDEGEYHLDFHVFAVEWNAEGITWFVDDQVYHTAGPQDLPAGKEWVYDHPFFILLNLAVGGLWVGAPDEDTEFPQTMLIDWVRVYAPTD
jgi:beta-glucanase (GH16 family)